jgi:hypothetical protein
MRYIIFMIGFFLMGTLIGCSSSEKMGQQDSLAEERISLNINEAVYFEFEKTDDQWLGRLTIHTLNEEGEKVVQSEYISNQDSTWTEFKELVDFLNMYSIGPQNELEDWVPNSSQLPQRVYSFEVFDGDTTRSFSYQDPLNDIRDYWEVQSILTFSSYIQSELSWVEVDG